MLLAPKKPNQTYTCVFGLILNIIDSKRINSDKIDSDIIDFEIRIDLCLDTIM